eukprot:161847_1
MPSKHSSSKKGNAPDYGHKYHLFGITPDSLATSKAMVFWGKSCGWFKLEWMYENRGDTGGRGKVKKVAFLRSTIENKCDSRLRVSLKNLTVFIELFGKASREDQYIFLNNCSLGFRVSKDELAVWDSAGFGVAQIFVLIAKRTVGLRDRLQMSVGTWTTMVSVVDEIIRGEVTFNAPNEVMNDNHNNQSLLPNNINPNPLNKPEINTSNESTTNTNKETSLPIHVIKHKTRGRLQESSNYKQSLRSTRIHPYYSCNNDAAPMKIMSIDDEAKQNLIVYRSSLGEYAADETSMWYGYDQDMLYVFITRPHGLRKMHKRAIAQRDMVQLCLRNKQLPGGHDDLRVNAGLEFKIAYTIAEMLNLATRVYEESDAFDVNRRLIENDPLGDQDYDLGEWNHPYENYSRLPRSKSQIDKAKKQNKAVLSTTIWPFRRDIFKLHDNSSPQEWKDQCMTWKQWGFMDWSKGYIIEFFPGMEARATEIGLIPEHDNNEVNLLGVDNDIEMKTNTKADLDMI